MIFVADSKTFLDDFINNTRDDVILDTQYVIISKMIAKSDKYDNVLKMTRLYPSNRLLSEYESDSDRDAFKDGYDLELFDSKELIAALITSVFNEGYNIIILCSKKEWKLGYLQVLKEFAWDYFEYPIYSLKDVMSEDVKQLPFDKAKVLKKCNTIIAEAKEEIRRNNLKTPAGRKKIVAGMSKKEKIKFLKKSNLYHKGMSKDDINESLEVFFIQ